jgi:carbohydrate kinase (thermoresistant glucokinase family)
MTPDQPAFLVVMGVSGSGKSTVSALLAARLGWMFEDADDLHPPENVAKMSAGQPLTDNDRRPWLLAVREWMDEARVAGKKAVIACSALKRSYRDILMGGRDDVRLVHLQGSAEVIAPRVAKRHGHFMPISLLESQFAALEEPGEDEHPIVVSIDATPEEIVDAIVREMQRPIAPSP